MAIGARLPWTSSRMSHQAIIEIAMAAGLKMNSLHVYIGRGPGGQQKGDKKEMKSCIFIESATQ